MLLVPIRIQCGLIFHMHRRKQSGKESEDLALRLKKRKNRG